MAWLITVEGGDGSGKSTLISRIQASLHEKNIPLLLTREPGGTEIGEEIREILLRPGRAVSPWTELFLYEAARAEHIAKVIRPALGEGKHVLCDRFTTSTLAYQGEARALGYENVELLNHLATQGIEPHITLWLKIPPDQGLQRIQNRKEKNRLDQEKIDFHEKVFKAFEKIVSKTPDRFIVLDATQSPNDVFRQLVEHPKWVSLWSKA